MSSSASWNVDYRKAGVIFSFFGPSFSTAGWLGRVITLAFRCRDYLNLSVSMEKVAKVAVLVLISNFLGIPFPRGSGRSRFYLAVSGCHDLYSTALQRRAQLDQFWPDSHVRPQRGEVKLYLVTVVGRTWGQDSSLLLIFHNHGDHLLCHTVPVPVKMRKPSDDFCHLVLSVSLLRIVRLWSKEKLRCLLFLFFMSKLAA